MPRINWGKLCKVYQTSDVSGPKHGVGTLRGVGSTTPYLDPHQDLAGWKGRTPG